MFILIFLFFSLSLFPQFQETIVVSASPYPTKLEEIKNNAEILKEKDLKEKQIKSLEEALRFSSSSIILRSGSPGKVSSIFLRGSESNHTLLLLEGIPLNDPYFGNLYLSNYLTESFDKIEVLKGPYSSLYGSDALGGVVSLFLKRNLKPYLSLSLGEKGYGDLNFGFSKGKYTFQFIKHFEKGRYDNDGWDENQGYFYFDGKNFKTMFFARKGKVEIPFEGGIITPLRNMKTEDFLLSFPFEKIYKNGWIMEGFGGFLKSNLLFKDPQDPWGYTYGETKTQRVFVNLKFHKNFESFHFAFGLEGKKDWAWDKSSFGKNLNGENKNNFALFFQSKKDFKHFSIQGGLRYDNSSTYGGVINPKFALFFPIKKINLYIQGGKGFRAPSLGELYFPYSGNKNLKEEELKSIEAGFSYENITLNFYKNYFKNLIDFDPLTYKFENIGKAETKGVELSFKNSFLILSLNYLKSENLIDKKELLRRPNFYGNLTLKKEFEYFKIFLSTIYVGERWDINQSFERIKMKPFMREDLSLSLKIKGNLIPKLKIENLFNSSYEEISGYKALGRRFILGFDLNF